jgi:two-component system, OmpR family, response regulator RstA
MQTSLRSATASPYVPQATAVPAMRCIALWSDDPAALPAWRDMLRAEGLHAVDLDAQGGEPDAMLLRISRGLSDQLGRLRDLRQQTPFAPLIVVCQALRDLDQVLALEMGADDVLDARWSAAVVAARLRSLWRRTAPAPGALAAGADSLRFGALSIRLREREVVHAGQRVPLTEGEFEVLWLLASHAGAALSRRDILRRVRGLEDQPLDRSIDNRVYRIRAKLADTHSAGQRIRTVRHRGYLFSPVGW